MSLKDALLKAGFKSTKTENERKHVPTHLKKKVERHQEQRNFCEICELIHPDVERFKHRLPHIDAEWICLNCADKEQVPDQFRVTAQSDASKGHRYRRAFGATKDFSAERPGAGRHEHKKKSGPPYPKKHPHSQNPRPKRKNYDDYDVDEDGDINFNR